MKYQSFDEIGSELCELDALHRIIKKAVKSGSHTPLKEALLREYIKEYSSLLERLFNHKAPVKTDFFMARVR